ncbi:choline transporter-like protein 5 isoform 6-T6 [Amazona ochrocephala]
MEILKRCFPGFSTKNGVLTVANRTTFNDGRGKTRNITDLREAADSINNVQDARSIGVKSFEDYANSWYIPDNSPLSCYQNTKKGRD